LGSTDIKKVVGGVLLQDLDTQPLDEKAFQVVTKRLPTPEETAQMKMAIKVAKHVKSNGICLVRDFATVGVGPGQTNRVTALDLAIGYAGKRAAGAVMGSDAFFPFSDCVEHAAEAGITAIIQPGGSVRDAESIEACDKAGIAMVFTGMRHFKH
jgi:phosphoribosylaminoimidazolecarboxamide formyltransferase/IMP cyclohydrolase